jgi:hypothetical protein
MSPYWAISGVPSRQCPYYQRSDTFFVPMDLQHLAGFDVRVSASVPGGGITSFS